MHLFARLFMYISCIHVYESPSPDRAARGGGRASPCQSAGSEKEGEPMPHLIIINVICMFVIIINYVYYH